MRSSIARVLVSLVAIIVSASLEELLPGAFGCGVPLLLAMSVALADRIGFAAAMAFAVTAGAFENSLSALPPMTCAFFFLAAAVAVRMLKMPFAVTLAAYPLYQLWLALVVPGASGGIFMRILVSIPFAALAAAAAALTVPSAERRFRFE